MPATSHGNAHLTPLAKLLLIAVIVVVFIGGLQFSMRQGWIPTPGVMKSLVPQKATDDVSKLQQVNSKEAIPHLPGPSSTVAHVSNVPIQLMNWEWNAQMGLFYANGGPDTTKGSLMEKHNVNLHLHREDSNANMKTALLKCGEQLKDGASACSLPATAGIVVMGDSAAQWAGELNPQLAKYGTKVIVAGAVGRSAGEDTVVGPIEWKGDPKKALGKAIVGVLRDGDWNIALKWEGDNGLCNNPDVDTYDPNCVNWISAPDEDYIKAVTEVYVPNRCSERDVVKNGHKTGKKAEVCPDAVVTWTPGDEKAIHGRGGVKIVSSREYAAQMPAVLIMVKKFADANHDEISNLLAAALEGGAQVKTYDTALRQASVISQAIYNDSGADPDYWYKYYKGVREGQNILGGSAAFDLADALAYFGLESGYDNKMRTTYTTFAGIVEQQYPDLFGKDHRLPPYSEAVDTSFLRGAQDIASNGPLPFSHTVEQPDYAAEAGGHRISSAQYHINFSVGSATPLPDGVLEIERLKRSIALTKLVIQLDGYTDNTGSPQVNEQLSEARAQAVKQYLQSHYPNDFPERRFISVSGHGDSDPVCPANNTPGCKAANRRVQVSLIGG
jgi:OOP family OmpA-OmpF porin